MRVSGTDIIFSRGDRIRCGSGTMARRVYAHMMRNPRRVGEGERTWILRIVAGVRRS